MYKAAPKSAEEVDPAPFDILRPPQWTAPLVFASPHSGRDYPAEFIAASRLDATTLRRSEDAFVDEFFAAAPAYGAPLLKARFPRAYIDANREAWELDPDMFDGPLPDFVNSASPRIKAGLGTIPRVVANGEEIYASKLPFDDARHAIEDNYMPYHAALAGLLAEATGKFGGCLLVDCHSMPSVGGPMDRDPGFRRVDFVLGDRHGDSCSPLIADLAAATLLDMDFAVTRNNPYAGGFTTIHYGDPENGIHVLQIEINRGLYMDEMRVRRGDGHRGLCDRMETLIEALTGIDPEIL
ncbi:MAG: N-formylglutamate amidohydrolase [Alphaproteobacteria bacterium]